MDNRRKFIGKLTLGAASLCVPFIGARADETVTVGVPRSIHTKFIQNSLSRLFGINLNFVEYTNPRKFTNDIITGRVRIDMGVSLYGEAVRLHEAELLAKLNQRFVPNIINLQGEYLNDFNENLSIIPLNSVYSGIAYNKQKIQKIHSWRILFDDRPKNVNVGWVNHPKIMSETALLALGMESKTTNLLNPKVNSYIRKCANANTIIDDFLLVRRVIAGDVDACISSASNVLLQLKDNPQLGFAFPGEGAIHDKVGAFILKDSKNKLEATSFIDFLLNPIVNVNLSQKMMTPSTLNVNNRTIDLAYLRNPYIYPENDKYKVVETLLPNENEYKLINNNLQDIFNV